jgi:imidazolonepropionase-like amidohydrolase
LVETERMVEAGVEPIKVLRIATKNGADYLGLEKLGSIAPGQVADLIIVDGDPSADIGALRKLKMTMKNGEVVVNNL